MQVLCKNLSRDFLKQRALDDFSYTFEQGAHYVIEGASGSGKSTLLYLIGGMDHPTSGEILVDGQNLYAQDDESLAYFRATHMGFVFQFHFLLPAMTNLENILMPALIQGTSKRKVIGKVEELAKHLGVFDYLKKFPYEISGGEQQRINIIRAVLMSPKLLLCDEPTGSLDSQNSTLVMNLIRELAIDNKSTLLVVTHNQEMARGFSNRLHLRDGKLSV